MRRSVLIGLTSLHSEVEVRRSTGQLIDQPDFSCVGRITCWSHSKTNTNSMWSVWKFHTQSWEEASRWSSTLIYCIRNNKERLFSPFLHVHSSTSVAASGFYVNFCFILPRKKIGKSDFFQNWRFGSAKEIAISAPLVITRWRYVNVHTEPMCAYSSVWNNVHSRT